MANYLLDSNVLILALRGTAHVLNLLGEWYRQQAKLHISVATRTEIMAGMRAHEEIRTLDILESMISIPSDNAIADQSGRWIYAYARQGIQRSLMPSSRPLPLFTISRW